MSDKDFKFLDLFKNKSTLTHMEWNTVCVFFEERKENSKKDPHLKIFLDMLSKKIDSNRLILRDYFPFFERLYFLLEKSHFKNYFHKYLAEFYLKKILNENVYEEKIKKLQDFVEEDIYTLPIEYLEKFKKKSLINIIASLFKLKK